MYIFSFLAPGKVVEHHIFCVCIAPEYGKMMVLPLLAPKPWFSKEWRKKFGRQCIYAARPLPPGEKLPVTNKKPDTWPGFPITDSTTVQSVFSPQPLGQQAAIGTTTNQ